MNAIATDPLDLNLRHLDAIAAVARCQSISRASAEANLSQPALTQALSRMEAQLGHRLFDRQAKGVVPTSAGSLFLPRIRRALDQIIDGGQVLRRAARLPPIAFLERMISMAQLRAFAAVDRFGSYAMAARGIGLSQPTVHRAVKELELLLGVPLFHHVHRAVRPTAAAVRMLRAVRLALVELRSGIEELQALTQAGAGRIRIGTLPLPRAGLLPTVLGRFTAANPRVAISIVESPYVELLTDLRTGTIDMILGALRDPPSSDDVVQHRLFADPLWVVGRSGHPLAAAGEADPATLGGYPWLVGAPGVPMRRFWDALFEGIERPALTIECSSILTARGLLLGGDWLTLMSSDQFRIEQQAGLLAPIGGAVPGSRRWIGYAVRRDWHPTATQSAFIDILEAAGRERSCTD